MPQTRGILLIMRYIRAAMKHGRSLSHNHPMIQINSLDAQRHWVVLIGSCPTLPKAYNDRDAADHTYRRDVNHTVSCHFEIDDPAPTTMS